MNSRNWRCRERWITVISFVVILRMSGGRQASALNCDRRSANSNRDDFRRTHRKTGSCLKRRHTQPGDHTQPPQRSANSSPTLDRVECNSRLDAGSLRRGSSDRFCNAHIPTASPSARAIGGAALVPGNRTLESVGMLAVVGRCAGHSVIRVWMADAQTDEMTADDHANHGHLAHLRTN